MLAERGAPPRAGLHGSESIPEPAVHPAVFSDHRRWGRTPGGPVLLPWYVLASAQPADPGVWRTQAAEQRLARRIIRREVCSSPSQGTSLMLLSATPTAWHWGLTPTRARRSSTAPERPIDGAGLGHSDQRSRFNRLLCDPLAGTWIRPSLWRGPVRRQGPSQAARHKSAFRGPLRAGMRVDSGLAHVPERRTIGGHASGPIDRTQPQPSTCSRR